MRSYQRFFAELKRRQVFRVAGLYGIVSFGVLQAADVMLPRLGLPDWSVTFMVAVVVLAFPIVLIGAWAFEVTPDGMRRTDSAEPGEIEAIVAQPPARRWPSGLLALVGVAALVASTWWVARRTAPAADAVPASSASATNGANLAASGSAEDGRPSIAVLPFADMSAGGDQEYFSDGISEEILGTLAKVRELRVAGRTSAFAYKNAEKDLREIGQELGVAYLVEGSVRKQGNDLRITAVLVDTDDGSRLWTDTYDRQFDDVFQIQTEIAEAIADELRVPLGLDRADLVRPTADLDAYDLYLAGRAGIRQRGSALGEAVRLFEAAIARDSAWAPAWAGLAEATELRTWYEEAWDRRPASLSERAAMMEYQWARAETAALRAIELDANNASAYVALGSVHRNRYEWQEAESAYLAALERSPDDPEAHQQFGQMLLEVGRIAEGRIATERAARIDRTPVRVLWYSVGRALNGELEAAMSISGEGLRDFPDFQFLRDAHERHTLYTGRYDDLVVMLEVPQPERPAAVAALRAGDLSFFPDSWQDRPDVWAALGDMDRALATLEERYAPGSTSSHAAIWGPLFDGYRDAPEFRNLLRYLNLEDATPQRTGDADGGQTS